MGHSGDPFFVPKNKRGLTFIKKEVSHRLFHFYHFLLNLR